MCGGGVLAGVEQSCNEQILEREREREAEQHERTDDLVELGYNNNPGLAECRDGEDKGRRRIISFSSSAVSSSEERRASSLDRSREESYSLSVMPTEVCVRG